MSLDWSLRMNTCLRMGLCTVVNGKMRCDMVMEFRFGQMELNMKVIGETIKLTEEESFGIQMVMSLMENGKTIKLMVMEFTRM